MLNVYMYTSYAVTLYMHVVQGVQKLHLYQNTMGATTLTHIYFVPQMIVTSVL